MNKNIAELLGEELSKQVTEKLGTVELAIMNNGSVVPADKYEQLKSDNKALETKYQTDISDFTSKLEEASKGTKDIDKLKASLETLTTDNKSLMEKYQKDTLNIKLDSAIDVALLKANVDEKYVPLLKTQINKDNLKAEDDNIIGLTDSIANLQTAYPDMFGQIKKTGVQPPSDHKNVDTSKKAQLIEKYNKAPAKEKLSIMTQIKQLE